MLDDSAVLPKTRAFDIKSWSIVTETSVRPGTQDAGR